MTSSALGMLVVVWGIILTVTGFCFYKLLKSDRDFGG